MFRSLPTVSFAEALLRSGALVPAAALAPTCVPSAFAPTPHVPTPVPSSLAPAAPPSPHHLHHAFALASFSIPWLSTHTGSTWRFMGNYKRGCK